VVAFGGAIGYSIYEQLLIYSHMVNDCDLPHLPAVEAAERRRMLLSGRTVEAIAETFRMLGDPTRVRILDALAGGELCVCDIAGLVGMSESAVSHQLRLLRGTRLVRPRRAGRQVFYSLDDQHIVELLKLSVTHVQEGAGAPLSLAKSDSQTPPGPPAALASNS
jgi:ArsR family transcriptional regulator, lead/cadmium/zinc/bismuth-responsive transcriptional repressor